MNKSIIIKRYESPCGTLLLGEYDGRLCMCDWLCRHDGERARARLAGTLNAAFAYGESELLDRAASQLDGYFAGRLRQSDVPLLCVGTPFQTEVWHRLQSLPYAATVSYGALARCVGRPRAVRATANAVGANLLSVFIPCHRVIGADGLHTGYAGGLTAKQHLIELERRCAKSDQTL